MPKLDTAQRLGLPVHAPERAHVPSQTLAHSPQYSRSGLFDRGRFRQDLRDRVLHAEAFLRALALGQVEHESDALVSFFAERSQTDQHGHAAPIFPKVLLLEWLDCPDPLQLCISPRVALAPFRRRQVRLVQATRDKILSIVSPHAEKRVICLKNATFEI